MSVHNGCYVKLANEFAYWAVDDGKRRIMANMAEVYAVKDRPLHIVSREELAAIEVFNPNPPKAKPRRKAKPRQRKPRTSRQTK